MLQTICSQPELRASLSARAAHYCASASDQSLLIDRTISAACDDPEPIDSDSIENALFKVMHHLAQLESRQSVLSDDEAFAAARPFAVSLHRTRRR